MKKSEKPRDLNKLAASIVDDAAEESPIREVVSGGFTLPAVPLSKKVVENPEVMSNGVPVTFIGPNDAVRSLP